MTAADILAQPLGTSALGPVLLPAGDKRSPGGVALSTRAGIVLVDAGMGADDGEEALAQASRASGSGRLAAVVWTGPDQGLGERVPEHTARVTADDAGPGHPLPGAGCAYRLGSDPVAVVWDEHSGLLAAGQLLAPGAPLLGHLGLGTARTALRTLAGLPVRTAIGAYGTVHTGEQARRALRSRLVYLDVVERIARAGSTACTSPRAAAADAWQRGELKAWDAAAPERHLLNIHAAYAHVQNRALGPDAWQEACGIAS
ncbi:hypothetical protein CLV63_12928 [Murinocardiopsis flavida]|uniref:Uncharacterized protein n=1 Tax=Murinocardiopsis flavida TaxID=645275 RepID=A0A2P8CUW6_9ACTN|nr:hypothetical protein [Murinocardiopsis flavida]PSK88742.1 hypothetical protein CLV63_12928 [Murinocardiopsis flavida]